MSNTSTSSGGGLTSFLFNGQPPPEVTSYGATTTGIPDWLAQAEIGLVQQGGNVAQGNINAGYPLANLPQIGAFNPNFNTAQGNVNDANNGLPQNYQAAATTTAGIMNGADNPWLTAQYDYGQANQGYNAGLNANSLGLVQPYADSATGMSSIGAAQPYLGQSAGLAQSAGSQNYLPLAQSYINQGIASNPLQAAQPLVNQASAPITSQINQIMQGSYIPQENNALATQAATNLSNYLLPASDAAFIGSGQSGSGRNQNYDALTTAYAQQNLLAQQSQNLQQGYQSAANTALGQQSNLSGLAGTVGGLGAAQQQALIGAGSNLANIGYQGAQTQLGAAGQLGSLGSTAGGLTNAQQGTLLNAGQLVNSANNADIQNQLQAAAGYTAQGTAGGQLENQAAEQQLQGANQLGNLSQQYQNTQLAQGQAQDVLGQEQQNYNTSAIQANNNNILNTANWTPSQLSWLSNILHGLPATGSTTNTTIQAPGTSFSASPASVLTGLGALSKVGT